MKFLKIAFLIILFPLISASTAHKFYVSITKIEYVVESESLQIITKIFTDDMEEVLQARYNKDISLGTKKETKAHTEILKEYILQKLKIRVNGKTVELNYLGREYENDIVKSYIEVPGIKNLKSIEVENKVLMDLFDEQQNIIHVKIAKRRRSMMLDVDNPKGVLNFD